MIFTAIRESHLGYIPVSLIVDHAPLRFRRASLESTVEMSQSLAKSGQLNPMALEALSDGKYRVLDGHRRWDAVRQIRADGGTWHKVLAHVFTGPLTPLQTLRLLHERNDRGGHAYGVTERGALFEHHRRAGLDLLKIARVYSITLAEVEDHLEVREAPAELAALLDTVPLSATQAAILSRRYQHWCAGSRPDLALPTAQRLIDHVRPGPVTMKTWRFLLDFYWTGKRPFMAPDIA